jgi:hypothetical protein
MCVLDGVSTRSLAGSGCESFVPVRCTGFMDGDFPGDLSLGQHTGDGKFDGETLLGRTWMFLLGGTGERRRKRQDSTAESFSQDEECFQTTPFFMVYIIY